MKYCTEPRCQFPVDNLTYRVLKDGTKHLVGFCVLHGWKFLPFVDNLKIPVSTKPLSSKKERGGAFRKINNYQKPTLNQAELL
ncbi:MAG: hypothetical protein US85_C0016G0012 [Candidatus Shapirobacteria bacterium GW2011_GWF1_38_23]|nr:MAG: hypothetical protein US85_C0016G0012 [Candidatus Shapirobacteria bacterium GW2011_GWF1_38_23]